MTPNTSRMDISDQKYGKLTAICFSERDKHGNNIWKCKCDCGESSYVRLGALRAGQIKQCMKCSAEEKVKYNIRTTRLKNIYTDMKRRCYVSKREDYHRYGGRGIQICEEWLENPELFEKWSLENGYSEELTIDRINNDGNYEPSNCRWVDFYVQANNRSNNHTLEYKGVSLTMTQWAEKLGIHRHTLLNRINSGEDEDTVFNSTDIRQQKSKSGIKGISWGSVHGTWQLRFRENGKRITIGTYKSLNNAIYAKNRYESERVVLKEKEVQAEIERQSKLK